MFNGIRAIIAVMHKLSTHFRRGLGYYLLGELFVDADKVVNVSQIETYHPVIWGGNTVKLHYARAEDLREYLNLTAIRGEVVVQFWLRPGDETVELSFGWSSGNDSLPGALEGLF